MGKKSKPNSAKVVETAKKPVILDSDEDVIDPTPEKNKKQMAKKRKIHVLSSDSEDESNKPKLLEGKGKNGTSNLKPVDSLKNVFGDAPVKQAKVVPMTKSQKNDTATSAGKPKNKKQKKVITELGVHDDEAFEKTLLDLDEDIFIENLDVLDKTIDEALAKDNSPAKDSQKHSSVVSPTGNTAVVFYILGTSKTCFCYRKNTKSQA